MSLPPSKPKPKAPARRNLVAIDGTMNHVARISVRVQEKGRQAWKDELLIGQRDAVREYIDCHNPLCQKGGFSLGDILREMIASRQPDYIGTCFCTGQEGDLEVPESLTSCQTRYDVQIELRLR